MDEDEARALGIQTYTGYTSCVEKERFVEVTL
jgi:hypothetical protein